ncbi:hypothetical protein K2173_007625 [Erythroxylum novogranatense]|uniref:Uncharacterized protein n=1 Tax=Erythroxylum novogranatense TaxID=1862640 RepID=A0AAV8TS26_9ROSI|nr:hypothetical protein K2173_007625 [Erythroxylum novogranatense]
MASNRVDSSKLLVVIKKYDINKFSYPSLLTALQYFISTLGVWILGKLGFLHHDDFTYETAKKFLPSTIIFYRAIFTNTNLSGHATMDTFIMFRFLTPLLVVIADNVFRKQPIPSKLIFVSLVVILSCATGYVATDSGFTLTYRCGYRFNLIRYQIRYNIRNITLTAYFWAFAYLVTIVTEMIYIKHIMSTIGLNTWGLVL